MQLAVLGSVRLRSASVAKAPAVESRDDSIVVLHSLRSALRSRIRAIIASLVVLAETVAVAHPGEEA